MAKEQGPVITRTGFSGSSLRVPKALDRCYTQIFPGKMRCNHCKSETGENHNKYCLVGVVEDQLRKEGKTYSWL